LSEVSLVGSTDAEEGFTEDAEGANNNEGKEVLTYEEKYEKA
jgi:hypothetical protein